MNPLADKHVAKAQGYLEKGDGYYHKAGEEMRAAKEAGATWVEIGDALGRADSWVRRIVRWHEDPANERSHAPFSGEEETARKAAAHTKSVLRNAPLEQVEQIIAELPAERQKAVAAAAGHEYLKTRTEFEDEERNRTPAQKKEREAVGEMLSDTTRKAASGFAGLGIAGHIEQATEELRELVADSSLTPETWKIIEKALTALIEEAQVAAAMVGLDVDLQEVR